MVVVVLSRAVTVAVYTWIDRAMPMVRKNELIIRVTVIFYEILVVYSFGLLVRTVGAIIVWSLNFVFHYDLLLCL